MRTNAISGVGAAENLAVAEGTLQAHVAQSFGCASLVSHPAEAVKGNADELDA